MIRVRIKSATYPNNWYKNLIGCIFKVDIAPYKMYRLRDNGPITIYNDEYREQTDGLGIHMSDAEQITETEINSPEDYIYFVKNAKQKLADDIVKLVKDFYKETKLDVEHITLNYFTYINDSNDKSYSTLRDALISLKSI